MSSHAGSRGASRAASPSGSGRCSSGPTSESGGTSSRSREGRSFVFRWPWLSDERLITTVSVTIKPAGYGSRVELTDGPFPLGEPGAIDAWGEALLLWGEALAMLRAQVDFSVDIRPRR